MSPKNRSQYQCVWIDVESIMRPKVDAEKTRRLKPALFSIEPYDVRRGSV